jgi:hypothetical protein
MMAVPSYRASSGLASTVTLKALLGGSERSRSDGARPHRQKPNQKPKKRPVPYGIDFVDRSPLSAASFAPHPDTGANSLSSKTAESPQPAQVDSSVSMKH